VTNVRHVCFGDGYGTGSNHRLVGCKFVRVGGRGDYRLASFDTGYPSKDHVIRDPVFEGGASLGSVNMGSGDHAFSLQWTLYVKAAPGTKVTANDKSGAECFSGSVAEEGLLEVPLSEYVRTPQGKTSLTPHRVTVGGSTKDITATKRQAFEVTGGAWKEMTPPEMKFLNLTGETPKGIGRSAAAGGSSRPSARPDTAAPASNANGEDAAVDPKAAKLYRDARSAERAGMRDLAKTLYRRLIEDYPDSPLAAKAREKVE
jgi:hypothetical protein